MESRCQTYTTNGIHTSFCQIWAIESDERHLVPRISKAVLRDIDSDARFYAYSQVGRELNYVLIDQ